MPLGPALQEPRRCLRSACCVKAGWPTSDPVLAGEFYRRSLEKYDQAYRIRSSHYPGINKATLLLIVGWLKSNAPGAPRALEISESAELAGRLLTDRPHWPRDQPDDETVWHPATAGEAHLLRQEWSQAAAQYRVALKGLSVTAHCASRCGARWNGS